MSPYLRCTLALLLAGIPGMLNAHEGHADEAPWRACDEKVTADPCAYENDAGDIYRGTCRMMSDHLICVRNQPIEKNHNAILNYPKTNARLLWYGAVRADRQPGAQSLEF